MSTADSVEHNHGYSRRLQRSPHTSTFAHMGAVYVYHDLYGYILEMSPDILALLDAFEEPQVREEVCGEFSGAFEDQVPETFVGILLQFGCLIQPGYDQTQDIWDFVPVKSRWTVWTKDDEEQVTFWAAWGERPLTTLTLSARETAIWKACDGEHTLDEIAQEFDRDAVRDVVVKLVHHDVQALKLSGVKMSFYTGGKMHMKPPYLTSTMPYASYDPKKDELPPGAESYFSPEGYYRTGIEDADAQFDHLETTLSHLLRRPHAALRNRTYGQALTEALIERGAVKEGAIKVLEVGGGLGFVARAVVEALQAHGREVTYHIVELSPTLAAAQRERCPGLPVTVHMGDCLTVDYPASDYDLVIANEMIGDLLSVKLTHEQLGMGEGEIDDAKWEQGLADAGVAGELIKKYTVPIGDAPDPFYLNIGAWQLLERLKTVMAPGATAVVTEYGEMVRYPKLSTHLDHPELSIHFGHLMIVAREMGFEADFAFVIDLLDMNRELKGMATTRSYFRALTAALADRGVVLEKIGYTKSTLKALLGDKVRLGKNLGDVEFDRIEDRLMGLVPHEFKALIVKQPSA